MSEPDNPQNPFDRLGVDPTLSPEELTERLRRLAERLPPEERKEIRALWRKLTLKDSERVKWAFFAHPRSDETSAEPVDELQRRVPPLVDRRDPPAMQASVADALLDFGCPSQVPETLRPEPGFADMATEADRAKNQEPTTKNPKP
jgi:hypothetical protein